MTIPSLECVGAADLYDGRHTLAREITGNPNLPVYAPLSGSARPQGYRLHRRRRPRSLAPPRRRRRLQRGQRHLLRKTHAHTGGRGSDMIAAAQKNKRIVQIGSQRASGVVFCPRLTSCIKTAFHRRRRNGRAHPRPQRSHRSLGISSAARSVPAESRLEYLDQRRAENPLQPRTLRPLALLEGIRHRRRRRFNGPPDHRHDVHSRLE